VLERNAHGRISQVLVFGIGRPLPGLARDKGRLGDGDPAIGIDSHSLIHGSTVTEQHFQICFDPDGAAQVVDENPVHGVGQILSGPRLGHLGAGDALPSRVGTPFILAKNIPRPRLAPRIDGH